MRGVVVGCDAAQEWLLPMWWSKYSETNNYPVTFVDFGMSSAAFQWCKERGNGVVLNRSADFLSEVSSEKAGKWEGLYKDEIWDLRKQWFKKPFALLLSPYERTVWLDLDCEVLADLSELFEMDLGKEKLALAKELEGYNSGVIAYEKGAYLIQQWADYAITENKEYMGDQNLLSDLILKQKKEVLELPEIYNWRIYANRDAVLHPNAKIIHWACPWGKDYLRRWGMTFSL